MLELIFASYWYWLSLALILLVLEIILPGIFLIWLGLGSAAVGVFLLLFPHASASWQLAALTISMLAAVGAGLKWQAGTRKNQPNQLNLGMSGYVGRTAVVSQSFVGGMGRVSLDGSSFPARSSDELEENQPVTISAVDGQTLVVNKSV